MTEIKSNLRIVKGGYHGYDCTVSDATEAMITFDCSVCGRGFLTEAPMEACGKLRDDCPQSEAGRAAYREKLMAMQTYRDIPPLP